MLWVNLANVLVRSPRGLFIFNIQIMFSGLKCLIYALLECEISRTHQMPMILWPWSSVGACSSLLLPSLMSMLTNCVAMRTRLQPSQSYTWKSSALKWLGRLWPCSHLNMWYILHEGNSGGPYPQRPGWRSYWKQITHQVLSCTLCRANACMYVSFYNSGFTWCWEGLHAWVGEGRTFSLSLASSVVLSLRASVVSLLLGCGFAHIYF